MRVLVADSDSLLTAAIQALLKSIPGFEVVGVIHLSNRSMPSTGRKRADVLVICLGLQGVEAIGQVSRILHQLNLPAALVSPNMSKEHAAQVLQAGVHALVPQSAPPRELEGAVRAAFARKTYLSPTLPTGVRQFAKRSLAGEPTPFDRLTDRQRSILKLIAEGRNTKEIAHRLKVSVKTVEFHRVRLMARLDIYNVPSLVRFAIRTGLVRFET